MMKERRQQHLIDYCVASWAAGFDTHAIAVKASEAGFAEPFSNLAPISEATVYNILAGYRPIKKAAA